MYRKAVNYLRGQAVAEVVCTAPERVVNLCAAHGIPFWDLTWLTETSFRVTTTLSGARRLAEVTADIGAQVTVCRKSGAPELWRRCRHRYVLLAAALVLPLLLGLVGGYPVGARTAAELVRRGELSPAEGARLLTFCNNAGPAFAIGVAGVSVFGSARTGAWLYLLHCAAALLTGLLFCRRPLPVTAMPKRPVPPQTGLTGQFLRAVEGAVSAMARVCGFVVFFLVLLRLAEGLIGPLPPLAAGVLELTNGILRLTPDRRGFVTAAALLGWGGLSVHCQTAAVTAGSGISLRLYVPAKAVQAALSAGLAALLAPYLLP